MKGGGKTMRKILFRGKQKEGRWEEGVYFKHDTIKVCFSSDDPKPRHLIIQDGFCDWGLEPPIHCVDVDPETVGQYTGLTDKNGKKIFEGDILKCSDGKFCVVEWDEPNARFIGFTIGVERFIAYVGREPKSEIIGNIHDNPELLKGGA